MIGAHSVAGSKFKLLMFEATEEGQWELLLQEDSIKVSLSIQECKELSERFTMTYKSITQQCRYMGSHSAPISVLCTMG